MESFQMNCDFNLPFFSKNDKKEQTNKQKTEKEKIHWVLPALRDYCLHYDWQLLAQQFQEK